jgi:hypothetical protein
MTCAEFDRWLDEDEARRFAGDRAVGPRASGAALAHARTCSRCGALWNAARSVEASLLAGRDETVAPPPGFVASVMARVERREAVRRPSLLESLWVLAADPVGAVSVTMALVIGLAAAWRPAWFSGAVAAMAALPSHWIDAFAVADPAGKVVRALAGGMSPTAWIGVGLAAGGLAAWGLVPLYRRVVRDIVLLAQGRSV